MGAYFCLGNYGIKKERKGTKLLLTLFQVSIMKLVAEGSNVSEEKYCMERRRILVDLDERVSGLNHEKEVVLRRKIESWVIKGCAGKSFFYWSVPDYL